MSDETKERHYRDTGLCKCRICGLTFNRSPETKDITWVMRQKGWYYHKECFEKRCQEIRELRDNDTADSLKDITWHYLKHIAKIPNLNYEKFDSQWNSFLRRKSPVMTPAGILAALQIYYGEMNGDPEKADGGIGIVPYIYIDAVRRAMNKLDRQKAINQNVLLQQKQIDSLKNIKIKKTKYKVNSFNIDAEEG